MKKTITLPASILEYFVIQDNEVYSWYRIPATDYVAGMPAAVLVPLMLPEIKKVIVKKKFVTITFVLRNKEEISAWKHTKTYIHEVFGVEEQPKRFPGIALAVVAAVAVAAAAVAVATNAEKAVEVCTKQAAALNEPVFNAYGANLCEWNLYRRSMQKQYDKLSK